MNIRKLATLATLCVCAACDAPARISGPALSADGERANAITSTVNEQDVPFHYVGPNPCNEEMITLEGSSHFVMHTTLNTNGLTPGFHLQTHVVSRGRGTNVLETKTYSGMAEDNQAIEVPDPTATALWETMMIVRGPERVDDFMAHLVAKLTFNANLVPTAVFEKPKVQCK